jgi:hypothetical protein
VPPSQSARAAAPPRLKGLAAAFARQPRLAVPAADPAQAPSQAPAPRRERDETIELLDDDDDDGGGGDALGAQAAPAATAPVLAPAPALAVPQPKRAGTLLSFVLTSCPLCGAQIRLGAGESATSARGAAAVNEHVDRCLREASERREKAGAKAR